MCTLCASYLVDCSNGTMDNTATVILLYRQVTGSAPYNVPLTIARSQRSYRVTSSEATLLELSFYKSVPFKIHGYWIKSNWSQTYYIQISLWCSQGSGVSAILGMYLAPRGGAPYTGKCAPGSKTKYIVRTDTFVLPDQFPLIFPCRAGGGGRKVGDTRDTNHPWTLWWCW